MKHPILNDGSRWCDECRQYQPADWFPIGWGLTKEEPAVFVGITCKMCHDWYLDRVLKEVARSVEIQKRAEEGNYE